jgi:dephospho-CoA kinase
MIIIGLTGSIGMGKSTTSSIFIEEGIPVYDADAAVEELYSVGGAAVAVVEKMFPGVTKDGAIDKTALGERVFDKLMAKESLKELENAIHPLLRVHRLDFFAKHVDAPIVVLDIPLLFETDGDKEVDAVVVVSCPVNVQRERVMARPGMTEKRLRDVLSRQMPDESKRNRADYVIDTSKGIDHAREGVRKILADVRKPDFKSRRIILVN